ncbi:ROK family transcriptional regulator [Bacillaceae bacterium]
MNEMVTGSFQLMKRINKTLILDIIRQHGPISRADIAKMTGLTPPTVTNLVRDLLNTGIVVEGERMESTGGRKPIMLRINPRAYYVIGGDVGISKIVAAVTDLEARIVAKVTRDLQHFANEEASGAQETVMALVKETIHRIIAQSGIDKDKFLGIGIGMHGLVDSETGTAVFAPNFPLRNVPVKRLLEEEFAIPAYLDNDVRAMALGESWYGHGKDVENFLFVNVGMGIGAGIVLNREVYRGVSQSAGEIGHTTVLEDGPRCNCGNYGCLETVAAAPAIAKRTIKEIKRGAVTSLRERVGERLEEITAKMVYEEAVKGDELSIRIIRDTGRFLGIAIANAINLFNPQLVVIGGGVAQAGEMLLEPLIQTAMNRALEVPARAVKILPSKLGEDAGVIGAAVLVLRRLFQVTKVGE